MRRFLLLLEAVALQVGWASSGQQPAARKAGPASGAQAAIGEAFRIAGTVVDATTGAPVAGAQVSIVVDQNPAGATAGSDGKFVFDGLKAGKYPLYAGARGYVQEGYNQHGSFLTAVVTGNGLDSEHVVFKLHPEAVLYGRVTNERGEAVRHAQVMLFGYQSWGTRRTAMVRPPTQTNDLGEYRFAHLRAGKYYVAVEAHPWYAQTGLRYMPEQQPTMRYRGGSFIVSGYPRPKPEAELDVVYSVTFYPGVTDGNAANPVELNWGESEEADIALQAVPSVHILVTNLPTDDKGDASYGVGASGRVMGTMEYGMPVTGAQIAPGEYEIAGLPPGVVTLHFNGAGGHPEDSRTLEVNASDGGTVDGRGAEATATVSGQVVFPPGSAAVTGGQVVLANEAGRNLGTQLEKDGTFKFAQVRAGTYRVMIGAQGQRLYASGVTATGAKTAGREVTFDGTAGDVVLTITAGRGLGRVMGVAKHDGKPMAGAMVILLPESRQNVEQDARIDQSDSDGTFMLANIIPGKYVLVAIADGWGLEWGKPEELKPYWAKGQVLQIGAEENKQVTVEAQEKAAATRDGNVD